MKYLETILDPEEVEEIKNTYNETIINNLDAENVVKIISYLKENKIDFYLDVVKNCLEIFLLDYGEFREKFEVIKNKYGKNYAEILAFNLSVFEVMI